MSECWAEGELRAYLDRELPADEQAQCAVHLKECMACSGLYLEVAERAARVGSLLASLPEPQARPRVERKRPAAVWAAAGALALAAAVMIGFVLLPKAHTPAPSPVVRMDPTPPSQPEPEPAQAPARVEPAILRRPNRPPSRTPVLRADYFVRLDDEPLETGVVVQVGLENSKLKAEYILGPDGRPRAIRVIEGK